MGRFGKGHGFEACVVKWVYALRSEAQFKALSLAEGDEVLLYHDLGAREGGLSLSEIEEIASGLQNTLLIQYDRLVEESEFEEHLNHCLELSRLGTLRVQDLGLAHALYEKGLSFQLVLEAGHANGEAIHAWLNLMGEKVERIVLNNEIPKRNLHPLLKGLKVPTETLGFGSLVMYYTPRSLLSWSGHSASEHLIQSEDMGPGQYRLSESSAGTVMYYNKDLSLLRYIGELEEAGLTHMRLDLREFEPEQISALLSSVRTQSDEAIKSVWGRPLLHGFYGENKSDSVFDRLSAKKVHWEQQPFGEVLDQTNSRLLVKLWSEERSLPLKLNAKDGKGRWHAWEVEQVESLWGTVSRENIENEVFFVERPRKFASGTLLYRGENAQLKQEGMGPS